MQERRVRVAAVATVVEIYGEFLANEASPSVDHRVHTHPIDDILSHIGCSMEGTEDEEAMQCDRKIQTSSGRVLTS